MKNKLKDLMIYLAISYLGSYLLLLIIFLAIANFANLGMLNIVLIGISLISLIFSIPFIANFFPAGKSNGTAIKNFIIVNIIASIIIFIIEMYIPSINEVIDLIIQQVFQMLIILGTAFLFLYDKDITKSTIYNTIGICAFLEFIYLILMIISFQSLEVVMILLPFKLFALVCTTIPAIVACFYISINNKIPPKR